MATACTPFDQSPFARGSSDTQCPAQWQTIHVDRGVTTDLSITVEDSRLLSLDQGSSNELDGISSNEVQVCRLIFRESYSSTDYYVVYAERTGAQTFTLHFSDGAVTAPGIYVADLVIYNTTPGASHNFDSVQNVPPVNDPINSAAMRPVYVQRMFLEVESSSVIVDSTGPLTISEIRVAIRDHCPSANYLIDDYEYTDKDIIICMRDVVDCWNETPPDVATYSVRNFPYRYHWKKAVVAKLLRMRGLVKLREWLPYSGGNVQVNEHSNWKDYAAMGNQLWEEWVDFMRRKKVELNIEGGFSGFSGSTTGW